MQIRTHIDPESGQPHHYAHGVTEDEVWELLHGTGEDRAGSEGSRVKTGQTRAGRFLRVIYVVDPEPDSVFVINAYEFRGKPLKAFRRRQRRKRR